jgi:uncharacterized peroxidase-related enzyme
MSRLPTVIDAGDDRQQALLGDVEHKLGRTPNLYRTMVNSPVALQGYLDFRDALLKGGFDARLREQMALAVAAANDCTYCVSAHHLRGSKIGIGPAELARNRAGDATDPHTAALLRFAQAVTAKRGRVSDEDIGAAREHGATDADLAEAVAHVALNTFSNWFNHVAEPELDFPPAPAADASATLEPAAAAAR